MYNWLKSYINGNELLFEAQYGSWENFPLSEQIRTRKINVYIWRLFSILRDRLIP